MEENQPKYCFVQFKFNYRTQLGKKNKSSFIPIGEEIRVVGSIPELGNNNYIL